MAADLMHEIRVAALVQAFHRAMEFWGRLEPVPDRYRQVRQYVLDKDPTALQEAEQRIQQEVS